MRLGQTTSPRKPVGRRLNPVRRSAMAVCTALVAAIGLSGCTKDAPDSTKYADSFGNSFLNPAEMQRLGRQPLQLPILNSLSSGYDEPNEEFPNARNVESADLQVNAADYVIGRNDLLQITLTDVTPGVETVKTSRVTESGNITLPLIPQQIQAAGLTEAQLQQAIQKQYQDQGIVKNAQVSVQVIEARNRTFQIRGAVGRAGQYAIVQADFRFLDALVLAGDVAIPNIEYAYVIRPPASRTNPPAATQPAVAPPDVTPRTGGGGGADLLAPKPPQTRPAGEGTPPPDRSDNTAPKPTGGATLEDATRGNAGGTNDRGPVFVNGNQAVGGANAPAAGTTGGVAPAPSATDANATPPEAKSGKFEFNSPLPDDESTIIRIPLRQLLNGDLKFNVVIRPQDTIVVPAPEAGEFYMGGHVQRVGVYSLTGRQITLKQAVISAGMLDELAIPERTEIIRRIGRDREIYVRLDLGKVFKGQQPDIFLKPYDIVQVGTNGLAPFIAAVRNGFRITYGLGFLYDRNFDTSQNNNNGR